MFREMLLPQVNFLLLCHLKKNKTCFLGEELSFKPSPFLEGKHLDTPIRESSEVTVTPGLFGTLLTCEYFCFPEPCLQGNETTFICFLESKRLSVLGANCGL